MNAHRVEATLESDGKLTLSELPFQAGDTVEVIILARAAEAKGRQMYPLRGKPVAYLDPTEPVARDDWEALK
ncbi:MAG: hypothetical protein LC774_14300 [Acidobacteria bacterium]|nr:hypothetical protein [Acidobacteriota bacterium]